MCGIVGIAGFRDDLLIERMCKSIEHRGPDNTGYFISDDFSIGHTRLSIIDLNSSANQPMSNDDGSLRLVYNGEIYNYLDLRQELERENIQFKTDSDCEVVLKSYEKWGKDCLLKFNGMFALAIVNATDNSIFIARDRVGIKPLYYYDSGNRILFASEIKSLLKYDRIPMEINSDLLAEYFLFRYTPGSDTFYKGIKKFPPGHMGTIKNAKLKISRYWDIPSHSQITRRSEDYYFEKFSYLLEDSVQKRLMSDVPFGMYLSGGIDSTIILALMNETMNTPVKTYSVDFFPSVGEGKSAEDTATRYATSHHKITVTKDDLELLPRILHHLDEPQGDAIILPSYKLSQQASKDVKMVLTGEGADEILTGYQFFKVTHYLYKFPNLVKLLKLGLAISPEVLINKLSNHPGHMGSKSKIRIQNLLDNNKSFIEKLESMIMLFDQKDIKRLLCIPQSAKDNSISMKYSLYEIQKHIYNDWLPNNILWRQDRMTMANSIEGRVPFLDHRLVEFAFQLPEKMKIRRLQDKFLLRKYSKSKIPFYNHKKRKKPFYIPLDYYIKTDVIQDYINTYLSKEKINNQGLFNWNETQRIIADSQKPDFLHAKQLFSLLMFQMWYSKQFDIIQ